MRRTLAGRLVAAGLLMALAAPAAAQQEVLPKELRGLDVVAVLHAREDTMKGMKAAMGDLAKMVEGEAPWDAVVAIDLAEVIERNTRAIPALFPPGTQIRGSNALSEVWDEPEAFAAKGEEAHVIATRLVESVRAAQSAADMADAFKETALSCRACHKTYKKPF